MARKIIDTPIGRWILKHQARLTKGNHHGNVLGFSIVKERFTASNERGHIAVSCVKAGWRVISSSGEYATRTDFVFNDHAMVNVLNSLLRDAAVKDQPLSS